MDDGLYLEDEMMRLLVPGRVVYVKDFDTIGIIISSFIASTKANSFIDISWDYERENLWELERYSRIRFNTLYKYIKEKSLGDFIITDIVLPYNDCIETLRVLNFFSKYQEKRKEIIQNIKNAIMAK